MSIADKNNIIEKIGEITDKIDKKALAGAVGLMLLSWGALPVVYFLLVRRKKDEKEDLEKKNEHKN